MLRALDPDDAPPARTRVPELGYSRRRADVVAEAGVADVGVAADGNPPAEVQEYDHYRKR